MPRQTSLFTWIVVGIIGLTVLQLAFVAQRAEEEKRGEALAEQERRSALTPQQRAVEDKELAEQRALDALIEAKAAAERAERDKQIGAVYACQEFIKKALRDPDTAGFVTPARDTFVEASKAGGGYHAQVKVRATNGFGGKTISYFDCRVLPEGSQWGLLALKEYPL